MNEVRMCMMMVKPNQLTNKMEEVMDALQGLIRKGFIQEVVVDGEVKYQLTDMGRKVVEAGDFRAENED